MGRKHIRRVSLSSKAIRESRARKHRQQKQDIALRAAIFRERVRRWLFGGPAPCPLDCEVYEHKNPPRR